MGALACPSEASCRPGRGSMRRELRLRKSKDFATVYREGKTFPSRLLVLRLRPNGLTHNRYGFVASRAAAGNAVSRNRLRRRLRETMRPLPLGDGWDAVIIVRRDASAAQYQELRGTLVSLLRRAKLLDDQATAEPKS